MENILSGFLDTVLGSSEPGSKNNRKYKCPFHQSSDFQKKKLEVDIVTDENGHNRYHCWVCGVKGRSIHSLLWRMGASKFEVESLNKIVVRNHDYKNEAEKFNGILPEEYVFMFDSNPKNIIAKHAFAFLKKRNVNEDDIYKYRIGFCDDGEYSERIIIPSYDDSGNMNFFIGRTFDNSSTLKYKYPKFSRDIIPFELHINWDLPIILCEGGFDMLAIKRNVIPLFGKSITPKLKKKLLSSKVKEVYIVLDNDAVDIAIKHAEELISFGKEVYVVIPEGGKDPSEMGFKSFTKMIQQAKPLTLNKIMQIKLQI